jgi:hypothetical protein
MSKRNALTDADGAVDLRAEQSGGVAKQIDGGLASRTSASRAR